VPYRLTRRSHSLSVRRASGAHARGAADGKIRHWILLEGGNVSKPGIVALCAWSGPAMVVLFLIAFVPLAHMVPALPPTMTGEQLVAFFEQHRTAIRFGMMLMMLGGGVGMLWPAAIADQMRRIEGGSRALSYTQMFAGAVSMFLFIPCALFWSVAAFRPERSTDLVLLLNDLAWFFFLMSPSPAMIQSVALGTAILSDRRESPLFPRWLGFFNLWAAVFFLPGSVLTFFKTGPFAWNGLFPFWIPLVIFSVWILFNTAYVLKACKRA
jgi:hypothetical protein